ncbi:MAG: DUF429 domain-containing protein [Acidobacteria bacterium]|nr:DUF429 domain-containing protein [Acidobacteriota bacterium]
MTIEEINRPWLGIDFSGDHRMWGPHRRSNVYIARIRVQQGRFLLSTLQTVQDLPGQTAPFQRLVDFLKRRKFTAAGIDAPFSVPGEYLPKGSHEALLKLVAELKAPKGWPFPAAQDFVCKVVSGRSLMSKKPLRKTEAAWKEKGLNVRSTLWAGPRGGAAMTAACLTLLHKAKCPVWPWDEAHQTGLIIEAFPAAQLCHWGMKYEGYNGDSQESRSNRKTLVASLPEFVEIPEKDRKKMKESADALDAVLCAFAAIAVSTGQLPASHSEQDSPDEGRIAVHDVELPADA